MNEGYWIVSLCLYPCPCTLTRKPLKSPHLWAEIPWASSDLVLVSYREGRSKQVARDRNQTHIITHYTFFLLSRYKGPAFVSKYLLFIPYPWTWFTLHSDFPFTRISSSNPHPVYPPNLIRALQPFPHPFKYCRLHSYLYIHYRTRNAEEETGSRVQNTWAVQYMHCTTESIFMKYTNQFL
jgi:hypothetical protein